MVMHMSKKLKRRLAFLTAFFITLSAHMMSEPKSEYTISDNAPYYATYSGGDIYIGKHRSDFPEEYCEGDIYVLDERDGKNPDMKICNSHLVYSPKHRKEILEVLCHYEECFPTDWDRSLDSMRLEWTVHNLSYLLGYDLKSSRDVDLDNADEENFDNKLLVKLLK